MRHPLLIGLRELAGDIKLILELKNRKNARKSSILTRQCVSQVFLLAPKGLFPARASIRKHIGCDEQLLPSTKPNNGNRILKSIRDKMGIVYGAQELGSIHGIRRKGKKIN